MKKANILWYIDSKHQQTTYGINLLIPRYKKELLLLALIKHKYSWEKVNSFLNILKYLPNFTFFFLKNRHFKKITMSNFT